MGPRRDRDEAEGGVDRCGLDEGRAGVEAGDCGEPEDAQREDPHGTSWGPGEGARGGVALHAPPHGGEGVGAVVERDWLLKEMGRGGCCRCTA